MAESRLLPYPSDEESAILVGSRSSRASSEHEVELLPMSKELPFASTTKEGLNQSSAEPPGMMWGEGNAIERFRDRFSGKGRKKVGVLHSLKALALSSWLNILLFNIPVAWVSHFREWHPSITFSLCFLSMVPLEHMFDWGGEQLALYCGKSLGALVTITLNNVVEATLAIILLTRCELKLLQSTIIGVVLLHLLLVPGATFLTGGARILHQHLHFAHMQLNHTLLTVGVMAILLPAAFFAGLSPNTPAAASAVLDTVVDTPNISHFLNMSRGMSVLLLIIYICSRIFLHRPPGKKNVLTVDADAPMEMKREEHQAATKHPEVNQYVLIIVLIVTVAIMAATAEWLVDSINFVITNGAIREEWFGLILLPIVSFSADGAIAIGYFVQYTLKMWLGEPTPPDTLAKAEAIDLSIQFMLFWMPLLVLLGWWMGKPMSMLFDIYEVATLLGACFLVNYVTADAKTNWAEGLILVSFYVMIAVCTWYYPGQPDIKGLLAC